MKQLVSGGGRKSDACVVESGVPQGSVVGPPFFLVHLEDITTTLNRAVISSLTDDTNTSQSINTPGDVESVQHDLHNVYTWAAQNNMELNQEKFELLRCGPNQNMKDATKPNCT